MLIVKHTVETDASKEAIWDLWKDVKNWSTWDHGIEYSWINGPFEKGVRGVLKPKGGPEIKTILTQVEPFVSFVDESNLPLGRIIVSHFLEENNGKTFVTHQVEMTGPLFFVYAILIGRNMKKNLPIEMQALVKKAETLSK